MPKQRLDTLLVELNLCSSRALAQRLIQAGEVRVNGQIIDKAGTEIDTEAQIHVKEKLPYVSRGGEKLAKALSVFAINVTNRICLDGGISTGGFTDCLLQNGAKKVYGVDVGYGQVDWRLRNDSRVVLLERTNLRHLQPQNLYQNGEIADLTVVDVSFISLTKVMPALWQLLTPPREAVWLVKPQFEVGKSRVGKKGVVRDPKDQTEAIFHVLQAALEIGWQYRGLTWSPLVGPAGNIEYLLWLAMDSQTPPVDQMEVAQVVKIAHQELKSS